VVCVCASSDQQWYEEIKTYLVLWERSGTLTWLDVPAGANTSHTQGDHLLHADLILLLLSPTFFAVHRCYDALFRALHEREQRQVPVVPIIVHACDWQESAAGALRPLPDSALPLAEWTHPERAYGQIRAGLARLLSGLFPAEPYLRPRVFQARDLPQGYVPRPQAFEQTRLLLLTAPGRRMTALTTALRGAGGFGKTTLALALCHDAEVQAAFPDGILWVELGAHPRSPRDLLESLLATLEPGRQAASTLEETREHWRVALQEWRGLLVIDDVWQAEALAPLLEGGAQCTRLITTRNDQLLPEATVRIPVDAMEAGEATALLKQRFPEELIVATAQPRIVRLARRLGHWPLLLTLAQGMLTLLVSYGQSLAEALAEVEQAYETRGVAAFHLEHAAQRQRSVEACLEVSLHHLAQVTHRQFQAVERYQELAVFPEDTDIPIRTISLFWQGSGGFHAWETNALCIRLHQLSLVLICDLGKGIVRLHDVLRSYLQHRAQATLPTLHARLLSAAWQGLELRRWAELPLAQEYLWHHLVFHLCQAGDFETLQTTLSDLGYLARKALYVGVTALETDLLQARTCLPMQASSQWIKQLSRQIGRIGHLLRQAHTLAEMGSLLLSMLDATLTTSDQRQALEYELPRPFLTAWHPLPSRASAALLRTLAGHRAAVSSCAVSSDGSFTVSASEDGTLNIWDVASSARRFTLAGHTAAVWDCTVSSDGSFIVSASEDGTLNIWDAVCGTERSALAGHTAAVWGCAVSSDGSFIVSASEDGTLKVWDAVSGAWRLTLAGHTGAVSGCAVSGDGSFIVSASEDGTLNIWDAVCGGVRLTLVGHTAAVWDCAVSGDGSFIVSASEDGTLNIWDAASGARRLTLVGHTAAVWGCAVSSDGSFIVSASEDGTLKIWDAASGAERFTLVGHTAAVWDCAVSGDGSLIVSASEDATLNIWDTASGAERLTPVDHPAAVWDCTVSSDGSFIVSASEDTTLNIWDAASGAERLTLAGHTGAVSSCAVSSDGSFIVSASEDTTLKVWDAASGTERFTLVGHAGEVSGCAVSSDGSFIVSASEDRTLKIWDAASGVERFTLAGHTAAVWDCAVSGDGSFIVSASEDGTLKIWDAASGVERFTLTGHIGIVSVCAVSDNGSLIVSASDDGILKVWDAASGVERLTLAGHTATVWDCAVSSDGLVIVSASDDGMLKVWDAATGRCLLAFPVDSALQGCAFHPDGTHLVVCGDQGIYFLQLVRG
jgi:WD40 repeat protein